MTEHFFTKCEQVPQPRTPASMEKLADLLYEIGQGALKRCNYELAIRWLERAHDSLDDQTLEMSGPEASELRLSIMHSIVHTWSKIKSPDASDKAWNMLKLMETVSPKVGLGS